MSMDESEELHPLVGTDIIIRNLQAKPEYNGLWGRCERWYPEKERYVVKIPFTGKTLLLKPFCVAPSEVDTSNAEVFVVSEALPTAAEKSKNKTKSYMINEEEVFEAAAGYIRKNAHVRRILSQRVKEGYKAKGPGALILNVYDVHSVRPRFLQDHSAHSILTNPEQTTWMSSKELEQKLGRAWTHGCGDVYQLQREWPEMCKSSGAFSQILNFQEWEDYCRDHNEDESDRKSQQGYEHWGLSEKNDMLPAAIGHVSRRATGETLPLVPENEREQLIMSYLQMRGHYDSMCSLVREAPIPPAAMRHAHTIEPIGNDTPIWQDEYHVDQSASGFYLLSFKLVPFAVQNHPRKGLPNLIDGTGWMVLGFESVTFWFPYMADKLEQAKSDEEALLMFAMPNTDKTDLPTEAALSYQGGSLFKNLPSSVTATEYRCSNPHCQAGELKVQAKGETRKEGPELSKCSRCRKAYYCRKECQTADWPRHKKECSRRKKAK